MKKKNRNKKLRIFVVPPDAVFPQVYTAPFKRLHSHQNHLNDKSGGLCAPTGGARIQQEPRYVTNARSRVYVNLCS